MFILGKFVKYYAECKLPFKNESFIDLKIKTLQIHMICNCLFHFLFSKFDL